MDDNAAIGDDIEDPDEDEGCNDKPDDDSSEVGNEALGEADATSTMEALDGNGEECSDVEDAEDAEDADTDGDGDSGDNGRGNANEDDADGEHDNEEDTGDAGKADIGVGNGEARSGDRGEQARALLGGGEEDSKHDGDAGEGWENDAACWLLTL